MTLAAAALLLAPTQLPRTARFAGYIAGRGTGVARRARAALDTIARESRLDALGEELRASVRDVERMRGEIRREMAASATEMKTRTDTGTGASATTMTTTSTSYGTERYTHATSTGNMGLFGTTSLLGDSADRIVFRVRPQPNAADLHGTSSLMEHTDERQQQQQQQRPKRRLGVAPAAAMGKVEETYTALLLLSPRHVHGGELTEMTENINALRHARSRSSSDFDVVVTISLCMYVCMHVCTCVRPSWNIRLAVQILSRRRAATTWVVAVKLERIFSYEQSKTRIGTYYQLYNKDENHE